MKRFSIIAALLLALCGARAQGPDDQYIRIYTLIQEADKLVSDLQPSDALPKYLEAQTALQRLQKGYPNWNPPVIAFRLSYLTTKIAALAPAAPASTSRLPSLPHQPQKLPSLLPPLPRLLPRQPLSPRPLSPRPLPHQPLPPRLLPHQPLLPQAAQRQTPRHRQAPLQPK